ncbi:MAG: signal peptidase II [Nanoarchaeota archaeon]
MMAIIKSKRDATASATANYSYSSYFLLFAGAAALVVLDQLTKAVIRGSLAPSHGIDLPAPLGMLQIVHISNTGSIFGVLKGTQLYISALSILVVAFLIIIYKGLNKGLQRLGAILIISGAIGNTIDRLLFGKVTDFIYVRPWPAFNLADTFLFLGTALLLLSFTTLPQRLLAWLLANRNRKRKKRK